LHRSGQAAMLSDRRGKYGCASAGSSQISENRDATVRRATDAPRLHERLSRGPEHSAGRDNVPADSRPHGPRCIRSIRSGKSPRCSVRSRHLAVGLGGWGKLKVARRPGFQRPAFDERIGPAAQGWNVDVNPVLPPDDRAGVIAELGPLLWKQGVREVLDMLRHKIMLVVQDEGLEKLDE